MPDNMRHTPFELRKQPNSRRVIIGRNRESNMLGTIILSTSGTGWTWKWVGRRKPTGTLEVPWHARRLPTGRRSVRLQVHSQYVDVSGNRSARMRIAEKLDRSPEISMTFLWPARRSCVCHNHRKLSSLSVCEAPNRMIAHIQRRTFCQSRRISREP